MLKENKGKIIATGLIILLPVIAGMYFWGELPDPMATHFNFDNEANGWSPKILAVFGLPLFLLAVHVVCLAATMLDPKRKSINSKMLQMVMLICPVCSIICSIQIYGYALGVNVDGRMLVHLLLGVIFIIFPNAAIIIPSAYGFPGRWLMRRIGTAPIIWQAGCIWRQAWLACSIYGCG